MIVRPLVALKVKAVLQLELEWKLTRKQCLNLMGSKRVNKDCVKSRVKVQKFKGTVKKK